VQPAPHAADMTASIPVRAVARGAWIIQVGAYPEEEKAQERIRQAQDLGKDLLGNANPFTEKVVKGTQELYRARFAGFSQSSAEAACSYFKRNAIDCISMKR
jgi:D-alanyl-D-alanine carboxypeptidase